MADVIGHITATTHLQYRDETGRFRAVLDRAAVNTARDLTNKGVELAKRNARRFRKTGELEAGIEPVHMGKKGRVDSTAPHAHPIEAGAVPHAIPRGDSIIMHPGNEAQPYLAPVGEQLAPFAPGILAKNYPG